MLAADHDQYPPKPQLFPRLLLAMWTWCRWLRFDIMSSYIADGFTPNVLFLKRKRKELLKSIRLKTEEDLLNVAVELLEASPEATSRLTNVSL